MRVVKFVRWDGNLYGSRDVCPTSELLDTGPLQAFESLDDYLAGFCERYSTIIHE
jgi:hypothetical protein